MRVLIVHPQFLEFGGAEKSILGLYEEIKKRFECELLYEFWKEHKKREYFLRSKVWKVVSLIYRFPKMFFSRRVKRSIIMNDVIIVSITGNLINAPLIWSSLILSKIYGKKTIAYIYEPLLSFWGLTKIENLLLKPIRFFDILTIKTFSPNKILCISEFIENYCKKALHLRKIDYIIYCIFHT